MVANTPTAPPTTDRETLHRLLDRWAGWITREADRIAVALHMDRDADQADALDRRQLAERVRAAVDRLPAGQREAVRAKFWHEATSREAGRDAVAEGLDRLRAALAGITLED